MSSNYQVTTGLKILIVEDDFSVATALNESLTDLGYEVSGISETGDDAITKAIRNEPDIILMDIKLKGDLDGIETATQIKEILDLPVIFLTAYSDDDILSRVKAAQPYGYIFKPFDERELITTIEIALYKRKMEAKLRESEKWLSSILKSMTEAIIATDTFGNVKLINKSAEIITGFTQGEARGKNLSEILQLVTKSGLTEKDWFEKSLNDGLRIGETDRIVKSKEKKHILVDYNAAPIKDETDSIIGLIVIFTKVNHSDKQIRKTNGSKKINIKSIPDIILLCDINGLILDYYGFVSDKSPFNTKNLKGTLLSDTLPEDLADTFKEYIARVAKTGKIEIWEYQIKIEHKIFYQEARIMMNKSRDFVITFRDMSKEKFAEAELSRYVEELQYNKIISDQNARELELVNKKLNDSENELLQLNASKDKFFSIIAHDLRSPFTSLLGFSEYLANEIDDMEVSQIKEFAQNIFRSARGTFSLLENLLQWSRLQTGKIEFVPAKLSLNEIVDQMFEIYSITALKKQITLERKLDYGLEVFADRYMVEAIFRNLLSNAIKFTPVDGTIVISAIKKKEVIEIHVSDNGVGILKEDIGKLFKIDEHVTTLGTQNEKGTGLGLMLCKEFVENNKGNIYVKSKVGKGTSFIFTLPNGNRGFLFEPKVSQKKPLKNLVNYKFSK